MAANVSYQNKVHKRQGGLELIVPTGCKLEQEAGGSIVQPVASKSSTPYTVLASESGTTFIAKVADCVFQLPATQAGLRYRFVASTLSTVTGLSVSPNAADKIMGNGFTAVDDHDAINTAATDRDGDSIEIVGDGVDGWYVVSVTGTWAEP